MCSGPSLGYLLRIHSFSLANFFCKSQCFCGVTCRGLSTVYLKDFLSGHLDIFFSGFCFSPPGDLGTLIVASCISFFNTSVSHFANTLLSEAVTCGLDLKPDFSCCVKPPTLLCVGGGYIAFDRALPMQISLSWNTSHSSGAAVDYLNSFVLFLRTVSCCNLK